MQGTHGGLEPPHGIVQHNTARRTWSKTLEVASQTGQTTQLRVSEDQSGICKVCLDVTMRTFACYWVVLAGNSSCFGKMVLPWAK